MIVCENIDTFEVEENKLIPGTTATISAVKNQSKHGQRKEELLFCKLFNIFFFAFDNLCLIVFWLKTLN